MKKLLFALLMFASVAASAQIEKPITKGNMMIGGAIKHSTMSIHLTNFQFNASPSFGYFVANQLAVGIELPVSMFRMSQIHNYSYGYSPFVRYYLKNGLFASVQFSHIFLDYQDINSIQSKNTQFMFTPGVGYSYFLNKNVAFEGGVFYEQSFYNNLAGNQGELSFRLGLQVFIP
jgi:hypothetical protein